MKKVFFFILATIILFVPLQSVNAGWVNGYFRNNGTYVNGYYRTEPDAYKWNNYSFDDDWSDSYNDNTWYKNYGYDPEPLDDDYISSYSRSNYYNNTYDYDYNFGYDDDYSSSNWWD